MAADTSKTQETIRGGGDNLLRDLRFILRPEFCSPAQAEIHHDDGGIIDRGSLVPDAPHGDRAFGASADVRGDNESDRYEVKGRPMTCIRVANAIFVRAILANDAGAKDLEEYYRFALEWYEWHADV